MPHTAKEREDGGRTRDCPKLQRAPQLFANRCALLLFILYLLLLLHFALLPLPLAFDLNAAVLLRRGGLVEFIVLRAQGLLGGLFHSQLLLQRVHLLVQGPYLRSRRRQVRKHLGQLLFVPAKTKATASKERKGASKIFQRFTNE